MNEETPMAPPAMHIVIEFEAAPYAYVENIKTAADNARMYAWLGFNEAACELLNLCGRLYDEGKVDMAPARKNIEVADPFAASGV